MASARVARRHPPWTAWPTEASAAAPCDPPSHILAGYSARRRCRTKLGLFAPLRKRPEPLRAARACDLHRPLCHPATEQVDGRQLQLGGLQPRLGPCSCGNQVMPVILAAAAVAAFDPFAVTERAA